MTLLTPALRFVLLYSHTGSALFLDCFYDIGAIGPHRVGPLLRHVNTAVCVPVPGSPLSLNIIVIVCKAVRSAGSLRRPLRLLRKEKYIKLCEADSFMIESSFL